MSRLDPDLSSYDFENPKHVELTERLLWRIHQLGYDWKDFEKTDGQIHSFTVTTTRRREPDRVERYGKKYCWIAYYELAGDQLAQGILQPDNYEGRLSLVDIDPTFPELPVEKKIEQFDLGLWDTPISEATIPFEWVDEDDERWLLLRGIAIVQDGNKKFRRIECEGLFTRSSHKEQLEKLVNLTTKPTWLSDHEHHYLFAGEAANESIVPFVEPERLRFEVGEVSERIEEQRLKFFREDGSEYPDGEIIRVRLRAYSSGVA